MSDGGIETTVRHTIGIEVGTGRFASVREVAILVDVETVFAIGESGDPVGDTESSPLVDETNDTPDVGTVGLENGYAIGHADDSANRLPKRHAG